MTVIVTAMVLIARHDLQNPCIILTLIIPILGFWILDGYRGGLGNLNTGDKWHFCSQSALLPFTRSHHDKTNTPEP